MTLCEFLGVIVIRVLSALLDDDWAAAVLHVDWQATAKAITKRGNNAFRRACFMLFLSSARTSFIRSMCPL